MAGSTPGRRTVQASVFLCVEAWSSSQIKWLSCLWVMDCCCSWQLGWLQGDELECSDGHHTVWKAIILQQPECSSTLCFKSQKHFKTFNSFEPEKQTPWVYQVPGPDVHPLGPGAPGEWIHQLVILVIEIRISECSFRQPLFASHCAKHEVTEMNFPASGAQYSAFCSLEPLGQCV